MLSRWVNRYRIYLLFAAVFGLTSAFVPGFLTMGNMVSLLKGGGVHALAAIGFTLVLVTGQLDLSFAACMTLGGMITIGMQPRHGWVGGLAAAMACGLAVGLFNGLLVTKGKVNSFIVTLGTLTVVSGLVNIYGGGGSLNVDDFRLADWLDAPSLLAPPIVFAVVATLFFELLLHRTTWGKNLLLTGGNLKTAWHAGIKTDGLVTGAFVLSGVLAALGGSLAAMKDSAANPAMGNPSLMIVITAVIVGGTSMKGGKGSVIGSAVAVLMLTAIANGLGIRGLGSEAQQIVSGLVLAVIVLYDAVVANRRELLKGVRADLMTDLTGKSGKIDSG
jgi:ribose/xylose/arabinose/galactoside ABC-type transport system permease subunit